MRVQRKYNHVELSLERGRNVGKLRVKGILEMALEDGI